MAAVPISRNCPFKPIVHFVVPTFDSHPQDNLLQVLNSLSVLESAIANVFGKISNRVQEERNKIQAFDSRIDSAKKKVSELSQSRIAVTVTSPATFPETPSISSSKLLFEDLPNKNVVEEPKKLQVESTSPVAISEVRPIPSAPTASSFLIFEKSFSTKRKMKASRRTAPKIETKLFSAPASLASRVEYRFDVDPYDYQPGFVAVEDHFQSDLPLKGIAEDVRCDWKPVSLDYSAIVPSFEELDGVDEVLPAQTSSNNGNSNDNCILMLVARQELEAVQQPVAQAVVVAVNQKQENPTLVSTTQAQQTSRPVVLNLISLPPVENSKPDPIPLVVAPKPTPSVRPKPTVTPVTQPAATEVQPKELNAIPTPIPLPVDFNTPKESTRSEERPSRSGFLADIENFDKRKLKNQNVAPVSSEATSVASSEAPAGPSGAPARPSRVPARPLSMAEQLRIVVMSRRGAMEEDNPEESDTDQDGEWNSNNQ